MSKTCIQTKLILIFSFKFIMDGVQIFDIKVDNANLILIDIKVGSEIVS